MSRLTRDGTAEPVSRDQILGRERGQREMLNLPAQLTMYGIGNLTRLIHTLVIYMCDRIHMYTYNKSAYQIPVNCHLYSCCCVFVISQDNHLPDKYVSTCNNGCELKYCLPAAVITVYTQELTLFCCCVLLHTGILIAALL